MRELRQSTSVDVGIGPFVDAGDGVTPETTLTITQSDIRLKKNNGNWAQKNASQTLSHEENGWYEVTLDATDTNTLGILVVAVNESGAAPVWDYFSVVSQQYWDAKYGTGNFSADVKAVNGDAGVPAKLARGANGLVLGAVSGSSSTTTSIDTDLAEATTDHFNGGVLIFVTGVLAGQKKPITDSDGAGTLTTVAFTEAPGDGDLFVIV